MATLEQHFESLKRPSPLGLKPQHDFIAFRKRPLLRLSQESAICLNPGFLQEKLESGLFWSMFNSLNSDADRASLFSTWGRLFEEYVSYLFARSLDGQGERYAAFPTFVDKQEEAFDGIIASDQTWLVMEYKGGFLRADAKYAENEDLFIKDVRLKFGRDHGAGVEQLARKIGQVFNANKLQRRSLANLDPSGVTTVVPVMVVQESFISSPITSTYLCGEFRCAMRTQPVSKHVACTALQILDVAEVESLRPYLASGQCSVAQCVMGRARLGDRAPSFHDYFREYIRANNLKRVVEPDFENRATAILNRISLRFFGHPSGAASKTAPGSQQ